LVYLILSLFWLCRKLAPLVERLSIALMLLSLWTAVIQSEALDAQLSFAQIVLAPSKNEIRDRAGWD